MEISGSARKDRDLARGIVRSSAEHNGEDKEKEQHNRASIVSHIDVSEASGTRRYTTPTIAGMDNMSDRAS